MADIPVGCEAHRWFGLPQTEYTRPAWPHLERWYADLRSRPARAACSTSPWNDSHENPPLQASRRLHGERPTSAIRSPSCSTAAGLDDEEMQRFAQLDQPVGNHLPAAAHRPRAPTTACASSRPAASCPSPAIRRSAAATPGCRPAAGPRRRARSCSNAASGLVPIRRDGERLAFAAPPLRAQRAEPDAAGQGGCARWACGRSRSSPRSWLDNGPSWLGLLLDDADTVLALEPDHRVLGAGQKVGVAAPRGRAPC